jgi:hemerythrin
MVPHVEATRTPTIEDLRAITQDHQRLAQCLDQLHRTCIHLNDHLSCESCSYEQLGVCRGQLPSFIHDLVDILNTHFYREEALMLCMQQQGKSGGDFRAHHDAHVRILHGLNKLFKEVQQLDRGSRTEEAYFHFDYIIQGTMAEHDRRFDNDLMLLLKQSLPNA